MLLKPGRTIYLILSLLALTIWCAVASANGGLISVKRVASGLSRPLYVTAPPGDTGRLFIVEQHTGRIKILNLSTGAVSAIPFLDIDGLATGNEQGLLGLAFDPNYAANGFFYINFTETNGTTNIRRYQVSAGDPDIADAATGTIVMIYAQPFSNHNGGWLTTELVPPAAGRFTPPPLLSQAVVTDGGWHRVALVWAGSRRRLYVDGAEVAADTESLAPLKSSDGGLYIGAGKSLDDASFWAGLIDDVRIYNVALMPAEVNAMAQ